MRACVIKSAGKSLQVCAEKKRNTEVKSLSPGQKAFEQVLLERVFGMRMKKNLAKKGEIHWNLQLLLGSLAGCLSLEQIRPIATEHLQGKESDTHSLTAPSLWQLTFKLQIKE